MLLVGAIEIVTRRSLLSEKMLPIFSPVGEWIESGKSVVPEHVMRLMYTRGKLKFGFTIES